MPEPSLADLPDSIRELVIKRQSFRNQGDFQASDKIRLEIENFGYNLKDTPAGAIVIASENNLTKPKTNYLVLFGSGEISPTGRQIHETVLTGIGKDNPHIVIITTPAGFQPNVKIVYQEIADFFTQHLTNFHPRISLIFANNIKEANNPGLIEPLKTADYIFTGPGSPTYAVNNLKNTLLLDTLISQVNAGASLGLASAATIAFSKHTLPVYEIYKVGEPLHWLPGLDVLSTLYKPLTIIPHFNNTEGGSKTDTSHCFMGNDRYQQLIRLLPPSTPVWGIDEQTAVIINLSKNHTATAGKGKLHLISPKS